MHFTEVATAAPTAQSQPSAIAKPAPPAAGPGATTDPVVSNVRVCSCALGPLGWRLCFCAGGLWPDELKGCCSRSEGVWLCAGDL
jgi:hypothetical protein